MAMMSDAEVRNLATTLETSEAREKKRAVEKREQTKENHRKWLELFYTGPGVAGPPASALRAGPVRRRRRQFLHPSHDLAG